MSNIEGNNTDGPSKKKAEQRKTTKRSKVWDEFIPEETPDGRKVAKCMHCGKYLSGDSKSGTTHLTRHLERACTKRMKKEEINNSVFDQERNLDLFAKMVIHGKIPLQYVGNPLFTEFARSLQPMYTHVDRVAVEKRCLAYYENEKNKLQNQFMKLTSRVSFVVALYGSHICIAAHFIDDDFKWVKRLIGFKEIPDKTQACIEAEVERCIYNWGLGKKMFACAATPACKFLPSGISHFDWGIKCPFIDIFGAFLLERVQEILYDYDECVGSMLSHLDDTTQEIEIFNKIVEEHKLDNRLDFMLYHADSNGVFRLKKMRDALYYKDVFYEMFGEKFVSLEDWSELERDVNIVELIYSMLGRFSTERSTSNLLVKAIFEILEDLDKLSSANGTSNHNYMIRLKLRGYLESCNKILFVASILDPRYKFQFVNHYPKVGEEELRGLLRDLYNKYERESKNMICSQTPGISEVDKYLNEDLVEDAGFDVLGWWKDNKSNYPILSMIARDVLALPLSSYFLPFGECSFDEFWTSIHSFGVGIRMSEALICCNDWMKYGYISGSDVGMPNKEGIDSLEITAVNATKRAKKSHRDCEGSRKLLCNLVIQSELPFEFVENPYFIEWAKFLQPLYVPLKQDVIREDCLSYYNNQGEIVLDEINKLTSAVSLSAEWEENTRRWFIGAHFVNDDFTLVRRIIGLQRKGKTKLLRCIHNWNFANKLLTFTCEVKNFDYNFFTVPHSDGPHSDSVDFKPSVVGCVASYLKKIADCILKLNVSIVVSIRRMNTHVFETPNAINLFNQIAEMNMVPPKKDFVLDNPKRWDCSFNMLHEALVYKDVFDAYEGYDRNFSSCKQWDGVEMIVKLLKPIYEAVIMLSSHAHSTSNLIIKTFYEISDLFFEASTALDRREFIFIPKRYFELYVNNCDILLVASVLDPRFKLIYAERFYLDSIACKSSIDAFLVYLWRKKNTNNTSSTDGVSQISDGSWRSELESYLSDGILEVENQNFNVLNWWKQLQAKSKYPVLSRMAQDILAVPAVSISHRSVFSNNVVLSGKILNDVTPNTLEARVCSKNWIDGIYNRGKNIFL